MDIEKSLYFIRIVTEHEGTRSVFSSPGEYVPTEEGFRFCYLTYGAPTELTLRGNRLFMTRRGDNGFSSIFEEGASGEMAMALQGAFASIPMRTHRLQILPSDSVFEAELEYDLLFESTFSHFSLHLCIFLGGPMKIQYLGHSCFAFDSGADFRIVTDPYGDVGLDLPRISADAVTVSHSHYDHCNIGGIACKSVLDRAGEYELGGIKIFAVKRWHDEVHGAKRGENLIFSYFIDGVRIVHLGDSGMRAEELPKGLSPDILLIPVGGHYTIDAEEAMRYISMLSSKIVIPMHYQVKGLTVDIEGVERFAKLASQKYPVEKAGSVLEVTAKTLPQTTKIIIMERDIYGNE